MKTLIIVDEQYGFFNPLGHLYVKGSEYVPQKTIEYINKHHDEIAKVIMTLDWHPYKDNAYSEPNMKWPMHCYQYSWDASIPNELIDIIMKYSIPFEFFIKGNDENSDHTEYGAFENIGTYCQPNGDLEICVNNRKCNCPINITTKDVVVCGIAGDYCVKNTIANLLKYDGPIDMNIEVYLDGIASIDDGTILKYFIKENNLNTI